MPDHRERQVGLGRLDRIADHAVGDIGERGAGLPRLQLARDVPGDGRDQRSLRVDLPPAVGQRGQPIRRRQPAGRSRTRSPRPHAPAGAPPRGRRPTRPPVRGDRRPPPRSAPTAPTPGRGSTPARAPAPSPGTRARAPCPSASPGSTSRRNTSNDCDVDRETQPGEQLLGRRPVHAGLGATGPANASSSGR